MRKEDASLFFIGEVDDENVREFILSANNLKLQFRDTLDIEKQNGNKRKKKFCINIYINTYGGTVSSSLEMFHYIKQLNKEFDIQMICNSTIKSAGITIFLAGDKRFISRNATAFLHNPRDVIPAGMIATFEEKDYKKMKKSISMSVKQYKNILLSTDIKIDRKTLTKLMDEKTTINAREMIKYGIAHKII